MTAVPVPSAVLRATATTIDRDALAKAIAETRCTQIFGQSAINPDWETLHKSTRQSYYELADEVLAKLPEPAVPYTDPRDGDEVEVTFTGTIKPTGGHLCLFGEGLFLNDKNLVKALDEGRVTLVKAAAPQYQPGRIYRSEPSGDLWRYVGPDSGLAGDWIDLGTGDVYSSGVDVVPTDGMQPMDLVPAQVKP